jgi:hypothetical protein
VSFLKSLSGLISDREQIIAAVLDCVNQGKAPEGDWLSRARKPGDHWRDIKRALRRASTQASA